MDYDTHPLLTAFLWLSIDVILAFHVWQESISTTLNHIPPFVGRLCFLKHTKTFNLMNLTHENEKYYTCNALEMYNLVMNEYKNIAAFLHIPMRYRKSNLVNMQTFLFWQPNMCFNSILYLKIIFSFYIQGLLIIEAISLWHQFYVTGNIIDVFFEDCIFMLNKFAGVLFVIIAKTLLRKLTVN